MTGTDAAAVICRPQLRPRVQIGDICIDAVTLPEALGRIEALVDAAAGGAVFTPNVDHVVIARRNHALRRAYGRAALAIADGMPLVWLSRLMRQRLPGRVAGSDIFMPLMQLAARRRWRVYLLGGTPHVAAAAAAHLTTRVGVDVVGWSSPRIAFDGSDQTGGSLEAVVAARPHLLVVAFGNPKQELWTDAAREHLGATVALGFGAVLDFVSGTQKRAPEWLARAGGEWLHRLLQEPRRLWRRYLIQDSRFLLIACESVWRSWRVPQA